MTYDTRFAKYTTPASIALLIMAVAAVFLRSTAFDFVNYDDVVHVQENPLICNFSWASFVRFWSSPYEGLYIPVTYTVWGVLTNLSAQSATSQGLPVPMWFHGINILAHLVMVLVIFNILYRLLNDHLGALAGALFFAVHPVQIETVAWVSSLKGLLGGLGALAALWLYLLYCQVPQEQTGRRRTKLFLATTIYLLGLCAGPVAVVTPLLAGMMGWLVLEQRGREFRNLLLGWVALSLPVLILTKLAQPDSGQDFLPTLPQRLLVAGDALSFYLGMLAWPLQLGADYGRTPEFILSQPWVYGTALLPLAILAFLAWRCRQPLPWLAAAFFLIPLLPVLGLVSFNFQKISTVADRYLYLPMLGPALMLGWLISRHRQRWLLFLLLIGLCGLAARSILLLEHWRDSYALINRTLEINPASSTALNNLGIAYLDEKRYQEAIAVYEKSAAVDPDNPVAYMNLGNLYRGFGNHDAAIKNYQKSIELVPNEAMNYCYLGEIYLRQGNAPAANRQFKLAVERDPSLTRAQAGIDATAQQMHP